MKTRQKLRSISIMLIMIIVMIAITELVSAQTGASVLLPRDVLFDQKLKKERIEIP